MRNYYFLFLALSIFSIQSCDDGDVITFQLDFEESFKACEGVSSIVFYKTKENPSESLALLINNFTLEEVLQVSTDNTLSITKSGTLYYRTYSDASLPNNLFCSDIPPQVGITQNDVDAVTATITTLLVEDDNDGILAILEDINGNGNLEDDDTDRDTIPNYLDADDDGDNVLTKDEKPDPNNDNAINDAQDTDDDNIPDYLDSDDDGDGVNTRDEENNSQDLNPANDITNSDIGADYLNPSVSSQVVATAYRQHTILQTYTVSIKISEISLKLLSQDELDFGILEDSSLNTSRTVTPQF